MKKFICVLFLAILAGCGNGFNSSNCFLAVRNAYPDAEVSVIPKNDFRFLVRKSNGEVIIAETMAMDTKVTAEIIVFRANK